MSDEICDSIDSCNGLDLHHVNSSFLLTMAVFLLTEVSIDDWAKVVF